MPAVYETTTNHRLPCTLTPSSHTSGGGRLTFGGGVWRIPARGVGISRRGRMEDVILFPGGWLWRFRPFRRFISRLLQISELAI